MPGLLPVWTKSQRQALLIVCMIGIVYLAVQQWRQPAAVPDPLPDRSPRGDELDDRLDPNTADAAELSAIPNLGEIRAAQIVAYRDKFESEHPNQMAFQTIDDFSHIKGIGPSTLTTLQHYLRFPR